MTDQGATPEAKQDRGSWMIWTGIALLVVGLGLTALTYANAKDGRYVVAIGPIASGIIFILRGLGRRDAIHATLLPIRWTIAEGATVPPLGRVFETQDIDQPWGVGEAIGVGLRVLRDRWRAVVVPYLPAAVASALIAGYVALVRLNLAPLPPLGPPDRAPVVSLAAAGSAALLVLVLSMIGISALYETTLAAVRKEPLAPGVLGRAIGRAPALFILTLFIGLCALVPTGLLAMPFVFAPFFVVDGNASIGEALRKSWRASRQYVGTIWLFHLALLPLAIVGTTTSLGALISVPLQITGMAYGYVRATGKNDLPWLQAEFSSRSFRSYLQLTFLALVLVFGLLIVGVHSLPTLRGTAWTLKDTAVRATTIVTGVAAIIVLLALLLPYILDRLEGRRFTSFIAARHVRSQKSGFLTVISILSICGVAISSCALSSVVSVMGGFSADLKRKILGNNAHIVVDTTSAAPFDDYDATLKQVRAVPGVTGATPVVRGEVMASSSSNLAGVIVTGIDPRSILGVVDLAHNIEVGSLDYLQHPDKLTKLPPNEVIGIGPGGEQYYKMPDLPALPDDIDPGVRSVIINRAERPGIIIGRELAKTLHVYVGDEVTLVSPLGDLGPMGVMPRTKKFRVAAVFYSGMYEYDATSVYTMIDVAQDYFQTGGKISGIEIKVEEAERAEQVTPQVVTAIARPDLRVRDWREINKNLFSALKLERFATFVILSIAIMVASFCIVCTLLLMVTEKGKEIAILKAIGASDGAILRIFMIEGMIIGGIGTVFGVVTGLAVCTGLSWFGLRLDPEVYYIDRLPISVNGWDFLTVALAALTICTLSTLYPAFAASRLRPVDGLRYE